jgi:penicillin-insensitive murein DD-endopeptidase
MRAKAPSVKLVVADLSGKGGGERIAFHRSHQTGRDVDLLYYMRDANGQPFEPDAMHAFDARARARDGSGLSVDIPRTWALVKELLTAPEAAVQWIFMYQPIALRLIEYAAKIGEPEVLIERARKACRQPGDSARHDDHMHVRVYCAAADRAYGCVDIGPLELLAEREAEPSPIDELASAMTASMAAAAPPAPVPATGAPTDGDAARLAAAALGGAGQGAVSTLAQGALGAAAITPDAAGAAPPSATSAVSPNAVPQRLGRMLRTQLNLRSWR